MSLRTITLGVLVYSLVALFAPVAFTQTCPGSSCCEYLVKFSRQKSEDDVNTALWHNALAVLRYFKDSRIYYVTDASCRLSTEVLNELNAEPGVIYAEPNYEVSASVIPNDPLYPDLWALNNSGQYNNGIVGVDLGMEFVWNALTEPDPVVVAILDSGIDYTHEDLVANMWRNDGEIPDNGLDDDVNGYVDDYYGYNFFADNSDPYDDYFHGTHVAGIIGAVGDNGIGVIGVDRQARLMAVKFLGASGTGSLSDAIAGIEYAVQNGAKVINNSWDFYYAGTQGLPDNPAQEPVQSLRDAIAAADAAGVIFVAAAGNNGMNADEYPTYPGSYSVGNIMSVAATDVDDSVPAFSNYGAIAVDLGAPGVLIESTYPVWKESPPYHFLSGTSMAAPHVTGAAAILWAEEPALTHRQVIDAVLAGVQPVADLQGKSVTGGRLDVAKTFALNTEAVNHPPVANAGTTQTRTLGDTIILNGSATDEDGDAPLTFVWTLVSPANETESFTGSQFSFTGVLAGTYSATLIVNDGKSDSLPATVKIYVILPEPTNQAPLASAGPNQLRKVGDGVLLNGKGTDADGDSLTYLWTFVVPNGSQAMLVSKTDPITTFTADITGVYFATLTVNDGEVSHSATAKIYVTLPTTVNHVPVVSAGPNQLRRIGDTVLLQGKGTDEDGDALTYQWTLTVPGGSGALLNSPSSATASFVADITGTYSATLAVSDGKSTSAPAMAKIYITKAITTAMLTKFNSRVAGEMPGTPTQNVMIEAQREGLLSVLDPESGGQIGLGETILLDASESTIAGDLPQDFEWILIEKPAGSTSIISGNDRIVAQFIPDIEGRYTVQLNVNSGKSTLYTERAFVAREANDEDIETAQTNGDNASGDSQGYHAGGCSLIVK